jgi:nucleotide-binding universal stress UspA family protein
MSGSPPAHAAVAGGALRYRMVTAPLDLAPGCERALSVAASLSTQWEAGLELLTIASPNLDLTADRWALEKLAASVAGYPVATRAVNGDPVESILELNEVPDELVVLASHGRGAMGELVLGSVSATVTRRARRPLVLVGPHGEDSATSPLASLLVAVDHSKRDAPATEVAVAWATALRLPTYFVHVAGPKESAAPWRTGAVERAQESLHAAGLDARAVDVEGDDLAVVLDEYAQSLDRPLTVVCTAARSPWAQLREPSHTSSLVRRRHGPVLVVTATGLG